MSLEEDEQLRGQVSEHTETQPQLEITDTLLVKFKEIMSVGLTRVLCTQAGCEKLYEIHTYENLY